MFWMELSQVGRLGGVDIQYVFFVLNYDNRDRQVKVGYDMEDMENFVVCYFGLRRFFVLRVGESQIRLVFWF